MLEAGIYIHIPFCKSRCTYCDFNTCAHMESHYSAYIESLCKEIRISAKSYLSLSIDTIYFGGGTPSYLPGEMIENVLDTVRNNYHVSPRCEVSLESNPADIQTEKVQIWLQAGVNRISMGMQSADEGELKMLGRRHCMQDVTAAVQCLRSGGLENINLDLMFGLPGQTLESWQRSVQAALDLDPAHLSLYALTVEEGTLLAERIAAGTLPAPDDDLAADMYEWVMNYLEQVGFRQYEISNWAREQNAADHRCRHNLIYWRNGTYLGFGTAAHSHYDKTRWANTTSIEGYIDALRLVDPKDGGTDTNGWIDQRVDLSEEEEMGETAMMGLRLVEEGLQETAFRERFGRSLFDAYKEQIEELTSLGLLEVIHNTQKGIRLSKHGRVLGNQVFYRFLGD